jgi:hypothetical protein
VAEDYPISHHENALRPARAEARALSRCLDAIPSLPGLKNRRLKDWRVNAALASAALDARVVSEHKLQNVLDQDEDPGGLGPAETLVHNLHGLYAELPYPESGPRRLELRADDLARLHQDLLQGTGLDASLDPAADLEAFCAWANTAELRRLTPALRGALVHYHLLRNPPFASDAGITTRLLEARILAAADIRHAPELLPGFYLDKAETYRSLLSAPDTPENRTAFLELFLGCNVQCLLKVLEVRSQALRGLAMAEWARTLRRDKQITERERDLVMLLLETGRPVTLRDLMGNPPFNALYRDKTEHTARRDLKRLLALQILVQEGKSHRLNFDAL